ncbi:unnamed protein product [Lathyrus oleraceus]|uniref:Uncharacterized protein n=2 Tax=Pisum sativum TaxID=3888 RepID=A0A9D4VU67_PEA|nr:protein NLP9-like isoform X2 [Pisum sativum]KAI5390373.1 hypothetical protein KIW84_075622 [Pisum sativum]
MEDQFSSKEKGISFWTPLDNGMKGSTASDDMFNNISELMNFDSYAGWCNGSSSITDQTLTNDLSSFAYSSPHDGLNLVEHIDGSFFMTESGGSYNVMDCEKVLLQQMETQLEFLDNENETNSNNNNNLDSQEQNGSFDMCNYMISKSPSWSLDERMMNALSFFKESAGGGILAQVWVPIKYGDEFVLTTTDQPYLLDQKLAGYREVSRSFTFSAETKTGSCCPGLPERVYNSHIPEWTSNVGYYHKSEYLRLDHAISHEVRGSIALPVSDMHSEVSCSAVLELVTTKEKPNFDKELEFVSHALQRVNLRTITPPRLLPQCVSNNKRAALTEITDILRAVCHAHRLPLALTWIPCYYTEGKGEESEKIRIKEGHTKSSDEKCVLCIEESACYINDKMAGGFVHACSEHHLEEGQGISGKALQSNHPFFYTDVKAYDISEYPLVHHARKYNLNAAVATRLRSTYTNDEDYVLEFFLPINMTGSSEQQLLLDNLSDTMRRICKSLRTVSEAELRGLEGSQDRFYKENVSGFFPMSKGSSQIAFTSDDHDLFQMSLNEINLKNNGNQATHSQTFSGSRKLAEKKRSAVEKNVSLSVLQQYFSGSLKDAAKRIGVCPTTLKRICRQHGISRWPSRKINKVNRSLKKIQTVLDSVQGVEGVLKFDPHTGGFVAGGSIIQQIGTHNKALVLPEKISVENSAVKLEDDGVLISNLCEEELKKDDVSSVDCIPDSTSWLCPKQNSIDSVLEIEEDRCDLNNSSLHDINSNSSFTLIELGLDEGKGVEEHNNPTSSSMTDSSNASGPMVHGSSSGSQSIENQKHSKVNSICVDSESKFAVKANFRGDTIRFKFDPCVGCFQLYEEVATRFKLQNGSFQLKYLDDEEEWVMLVNDSDLKECVEVLSDIGTQCVRLLVRDIHSSNNS